MALYGSLHGSLYESLWDLCMDLCVDLSMGSLYRPGSDLDLRVELDLGKKTEAWYLLLVAPQVSIWLKVYVSSSNFTNRC